MGEAALRLRLLPQLRARAEGGGPGRLALQRGNAGAAAAEDRAGGQGAARPSPVPALRRGGRDRRGTAGHRGACDGPVSAATGPRLRPRGYDSAGRTRYGTRAPALTGRRRNSEAGERPALSRNGDAPARG